MSKVSDAENVALGEAGPLLRFAAERIKDLDPALSLAIAEACAAKEEDKWTPQISQSFWIAFSKLCDLVKPVTMDCLAAAHRNIIACNWTKGRCERKNISLAERSSTRYLIVLIVLVVAILPLQLYVWTCMNLAKKIDDLVLSARTTNLQVFEDFKRLTLATADKDEIKHQYTPEEVAQGEKIKADSAALNLDVDRIYYEAQLLERISTFFIATPSNSGVEKTNKEAKEAWFDVYNDMAERLRGVQAAVHRIEERANLVVGIFSSFILPILFGATGAVAYVIRAISDQINTSTFSQNSPIRHLMRVALGTLSGVVVGLFVGLSAQLSLPPLALAFLAGYGVEAVFSTFDAMIDKFRQAKAG